MKLVEDHLTEEQKIPIVNWVVEEHFIIFRSSPNRSSNVEGAGGESATANAYGTELAR